MRRCLTVPFLWLLGGGCLKLDIMQMESQSARVLSHPFAKVPLIRVVPLQMFDHLELLFGLIITVSAEERVFIGMNEIVMS